MSGWSGDGLPPAAEARLARARSSGVRSSLLAVAGQVGLDACGFEAVGEVMGCIVQHIGWQGYGGCGWYPGIYGWSSGGTITSGGGRQGWAGFRPLVDALYHGWDTAVGRMLLEARQIGADGVVGLRLTESHLGEGNREFLALGTAVRATSGPHLARPFSTTLAGQDVAKLLHRGWAPAAVLVAVSVSIRHDDYYTRSAARTWSGNVEVPGYTELVQDTRADARNELARRVAMVGAEGAVLAEPVRLEIHEMEVAEGHSDHVGLARILADSIVRWRRDEAGEHAGGAGRARHGAGLVVPGLGGMQMVLPLSGVAPGRAARRARA